MGEWEVQLRVLLLQTKVAEKMKKKIMFYNLRSITFYSENCAVYEITRKDMAQPNRPQMTI
jgi:hypothetical protein